MDKKPEVAVYARFANENEIIPAKELVTALYCRTA